MDSGGTVGAAKAKSAAWADVEDDPQDVPVPMQVDASASTSSAPEPSLPDAPQETPEEVAARRTKLAEVIAAGKDDRKLEEKAKARSRSKSQPKSPKVKPFHGLVPPPSIPPPSPPPTPRPADPSPSSPSKASPQNQKPNKEGVRFSVGADGQVEAEVQSSEVSVDASEEKET